jgi:hypothetical protein
MFNKIRKNRKPSKTALKVALNIITLAAKPGIEKILPSGIVEATEKLLLTSGVAGATSVRWSRQSDPLYLYLYRCGWSARCPSMHGINAVASEG